MRLWTILFVFAGSATLAQTYPVSWTDLVNTSVNGDNSLTKSGAVGWIAGANSLNRINPNTDGYVQWTLTNVSNQYRISLSGYNAASDETYMNYTFYVNNAQLISYENATSGSHGAVSIGDVLRISRESTSVKFYKNGGVIRTLTVNASKPLRVDVSILNANGSIPAPVVSFDKQLFLKPAFIFPTVANNNGGMVVTPLGQYAPVNYSWNSGETISSISGKARGAYTITATDAVSHQVVKTYNLGYPVGWVDRLNVTVNSDNSITKTTTGILWDTGASSSNTLAASTDGWIEFSPTPGSVMIAGLTRHDLRKSSNNDINFGFGILANGDLIVYENGVSQYTGYFADGDLLRIARETNVMKYYHNGVLVRTGATVTDALIVDTSISSGTVPQINCSFDQKIIVRPIMTYPADVANTGGAINLNADGGNGPYVYAWSSSETTPGIANKARGQYSVTITDSYGRNFSGSYYLGYAASWTNYKNVYLNADNSFTKHTSGGLDGGAIAGNQLPASTDGFIEFIVVNPDVSIIMGLDQFSLLEDAFIDYGFYMIGGALSSRVNWGSDNAHGILVKGDVLKIERVGTQVRFHRNGTLLRTVTGATVNPLYADFCMSAVNLTSPAAVTTSFAQKAQQTFWSIADGDWNVPATWSLTEGGAAATIFPLTNDIVHVKGKTVSIGNPANNLNAGIMCAEVNITVTNSTTQLKVDGGFSSLKVRGDIKISGQGNNDATKALVVQHLAKLNGL